jgi:hypothetical protein
MAEPKNATTAKLKRKKDIFKTERICFRLLGKGLKKISKEFRCCHRGADNSINQSVKISPPLTKREKTPMAVY